MTDSANSRVMSDISSSDSGVCVTEGSGQERVSAKRSECLKVMYGRVQDAQLGTGVALA